MRSLRRARLALVAAVALVIAILATGFPVGTFVHQRVAIAAINRQLAAIDSRNAELRAEIVSLRQSSTIEAIAREEYGLVRPGQRSYVILPGKGARAVGAGTLGVQPIPPGDLVPASVSAYQSPSDMAPGGKPSSLWSRTVGELEFWRWAL
ncbi:MAG TPA: septum formation initiator family protein [Acidimicrobiales bacterium]|nr:septum formation initiator family protein [Acidimicrobiales bacterium]